MRAAKRENRCGIKDGKMSIVDWGEVVFLTMVAIVGISGVLKVLFVDKKIKQLSNSFL